MPFYPFWGRVSLLKQTKPKKKRSWYPYSSLSTGGPKKQPQRNLHTAKGSRLGHDKYVPCVAQLGNELTHESLLGDCVIFVSGNIRVWPDENARVIARKAILLFESV